MMESLCRTLKQVVDTQRDPNLSLVEFKAAAAAYDQLRSWLRACDAESIELAVPFFEKYGRPDLTQED